MLRQRLKGAALLDYYPPRVATVRDLRRLFPGLAISDEHEDARINAVERYVCLASNEGEEDAGWGGGLIANNRTGLK